MFSLYELRSSIPWMVIEKRVLGEVASDLHGPDEPSSGRDHAKTLLRGFDEEVKELP